MKNLVKSLNELKGAKFVGIREYEAKGNKEIANHVINVNVNRCKQMLLELKILRAITEKDIEILSEKHSIEISVFKQALKELIESHEKNTTGNNTAASLAQIEAYKSEGQAISKNHNTQLIYLFGSFVSKKVLKEGEAKKPVNSSQKTIAKNIIKKEFNLKSFYFRRFIVERSKVVAVNGTELDVNEFNLPSL